MSNPSTRVKNFLHDHPKIRNRVRWMRWQLKKIPGINRVSIAVDTHYFKNAGNERPNADEHSGGDEYSMAYGNFILQKVYGCVLDVGCGHGYLTQKIAHQERVESVVGVDKIADFKCLDPKITYMTHDLSSPEDFPGLFDVIVSSEFVEHISEEDHHKVLVKVAKALKPGGLYVGSTPHNPTNFKTSSGSRFHVREYNIPDLRAMLEYYFADVIVSALSEYGLVWEARAPKKVPGPTLSFDDAFPKITDKQFEEARAMALQMKAVLHARDAKDVSGDSRPSLIWQPISLFGYTLDPSREIVNSWRLHTPMFTGHDLVPLVEARYQKPSGKLIKRYLLRTEGLPGEYIARAPRILAECGWEFNGGIVNDDMIMYQRHLTTFYFHGMVEYLRSIENPVILEIGGGYGALAYYLKKLVPNIRYYLTDLPESLVFPAVYLKTVMPQYVDQGSIYDGIVENNNLLKKGSGFTFIPNYLLNDLDSKIKFDMVINTGSFGEMSEEQVESYACFIEKNLADRGFLYEENQNTYVTVSAILNKRFINKAFEGQQKSWAKNEGILNAVEEMGKEARESQSWNVRVKREIAEQSSRTIRRFPRLKSLVKKIVAH